MNMINSSATETHLVKVAVQTAGKVSKVIIIMITDYNQYTYWMALTKNLLF